MLPLGSLPSVLVSPLVSPHPQLAGAKMVAFGCPPFSATCARRPKGVDLTAKSKSINPVVKADKRLRPIQLTFEKIATDEHNLVLDIGSHEDA
jgi:hypothetical protein